MKQYELWWATLSSPAGRRPVLLLSRQSAYAYLNKFIAAEVNTRIRGLPVEVRLGSVEGLKQDCVANCDNLRTVSRSALVQRIGELSPRRYSEVKRAVAHALDWPEFAAME